MENLIGRKVIGFKFDGDYVDFSYSDDMDCYIGKAGEIIEIKHEAVKVNFKDGRGNWNYPLDQIKEHLVDEVPAKLHERWVIVKASELKELREFKESIKKLL